MRAVKHQYDCLITDLSNSSKAAFITLCKLLEEKDFIVIDCQVYTKHLESLGGINIPRDEFLELVEKGISMSPLKLSFNKK
ncbi:MAG: leucyl/phenylalanyl-tRNA--protein transferase [Clostridiaceae bacterium]|jgi:leucyl/phenylalanyl-tRNA--protein transferase|nr:leucyl/phenylalanyl-tRNA--protein transferase [Clostridiaceae bacterium]